MKFSKFMSFIEFSQKSCECMLFKRMEKIAIHHIVMLKQLVQYAPSLL